MTGYHDYLIVLSPPESIIKEIKKYKQFCHERIGEYDSHYSKAHITVQMLARKKPLWIEAIVLKLERELHGLPPVILDINGFDFFDHQETPTIYANVQHSSLTDIWFKNLKRHFGINKYEPHITITRSIPTKAFNKLWPCFKNLKWNEQFMVDKLTILRRETIGHDRNYKLHKEIPFNSKLDFYTFTNSKIKMPVIVAKKVDSAQMSLF